MLRKVLSRRRALAAAAAVLTVGTLTGCSPREGDPCQHRGDVYAAHGNTLTCHPDKDGKLRWRK